MNFTKEDQNTFLLVAAILVVCIVTVIVIFSLVWKIIADPIHQTADNIAYFFKVQQPVNYNFVVPAAPVQIPVQTVQDATIQAPQSTIKYELPYKDAQVLGASTENITNTPILQEAIKAKYLSGNDVTQIKFNVEIPSIGVNSPAMHGSDVEFILQQGFLIYPGSDLLDNGEIILLCYRSQFKSTDPKSCWYLDKLQKGDEITLDNFGSSTKYKIIGTNLIDFSNDFIYQKPADLTKSYLQIVTNDGTNRLVILAEKESVN